MSKDETKVLVLLYLKVIHNVIPFRLRISFIVVRHIAADTAGKKVSRNNSLRTNIKSNHITIVQFMTELCTIVTTQVNWNSGLNKIDARYSRYLDYYHHIQGSSISLT